MFYVGNIVKNLNLQGIFSVVRFSMITFTTQKVRSFSEPFESSGKVFCTFIDIYFPIEYFFSSPFSKPSVIANNFTFQKTAKHKSNAISQPKNVNQMFNLLILFCFLWKIINNKAKTSLTWSFSNLPYPHSCVPSVRSVRSTNRPLVQEENIAPPPKPHRSQAARKSVELRANFYLAYTGNA